MVLGFTSELGWDTFSALFHRLQNEFHVPDLKTVKYFVLQHPQISKPIRQGAWLWLGGYVAEAFTFSKRIGRAMKKLAKGLVMGGLAWAVLSATYYESNVPTVPQHNPNNFYQSKWYGGSVYEPQTGVAPDIPIYA